MCPFHVPGSHLADMTLTQQLCWISLGTISDGRHDHPAHLFQCLDRVPALCRRGRPAIKDARTFVQILDFCGVAVRWNASRSGDANPQVPTRGPSQTCVPSGLLWQHPRAHICQDMQRPGGSRCIHFTSRAHSGRLLSGGFRLISYFGWVCDGTCSSGRLFDVIEVGRGSLSLPLRFLRATVGFSQHDTRADRKLFNHSAAFDPSLTLTCVSHREKSPGAQRDWGKLVRFILLWPWSSGCLDVAVAGCVQLR